MKSENNDKCKIVQDLMPSYLENLLSTESKSFVDEHISTCDECKKYLDVMSENMLTEKKEQEETNKLEIDSLKKYRHKMTILKRILLIILIIVITLITALFTRYSYNKSIINKAMKKVEELELSNNFHINRKSTDINYITNTTTESTYDIYYKDGKYKRVGDWFVMYGSIDSNNYLEIFHETKSIENTQANYIPYTKDDLTSLYSHISTVGNTKNPNIVQIYMLNIISIKKTKYNDRDCYVVRTGESDSGYNEFWIDKDTNTMFRQVSEHYGLYYRENIYTLTFNQTLDEDVEIDNLEQYSNYIRKNVNLVDETTKNILEDLREKNN